MPALTFDSGLFFDSPGMTWDSAAPNPTNTMAQQNLAAIRVDAAWMTQLHTLIAAVKTHLQTKAVPLTVEQRKKHTGYGPENTSMVQNGIALIRDNAGWFPTTFARAELLLDVSDRDLYVGERGAMMEIAELFDDTLHAIESDIVKGVLAARPFIEESAELSGMSNNVVDEFIAWFQRFGPQGDAPPPPPPPPTR